MQIDFAGLKNIIRNNDAPGMPESGTYKPACVFLLLFDLENPHILAIQKADSEGYPWRNQVALPGGHLDAADANPLEGAFRVNTDKVTAGQVGHGRGFVSLDPQLRGCAPVQKTGQ